MNPHVRRFVGWLFLSQFFKRLASYTSRLLSEHYSLLTALPSIGLLVYCKHFRIASINGEYLMQAMQYLDSAIYKQGWNDSEPNQASRLLVKKINWPSCLIFFLSLVTLEVNKWRFSWTLTNFSRFFNMHGRVKVKTTEQQEREKKIERDAKLKAYRKVGK